MSKTFLSDNNTRRRKAIYQCEECNKDYNPSYVNQRFCSKSCSNKKCKRRTKKISYCFREGCNNELDFYANKFCVSCRNLGYSKARTFNGKLLSECTLAEASAKRIGGANAYDNIRAHARALLKSRIKSGEGCEHCGWDHHVQVCHIRSIKDFPNTALISEINHPNNLKLLCPNCHWLFDNKNNTPGRT